MNCNTVKTCENPNDMKRLPSRTETLSSLAAGLAPLSFGFVLGYSSPAILGLEQDGLLCTESQVSWFGSLVNVGMVAGGAIAGRLADNLGRKLTLMLASVPLATGWMCIISAWDYRLLYIGRVFTGFGAGLAMMFPLYVAEVASKEHRGGFGMLGQIGPTSGTALSFVIAMGLNWQWLALVAMTVPTMLVVAMVKVPETPRWLISKGNNEEARDVLLSLRKTSSEDPNFLQELHAIETNSKGDTKLTKADLWAVRKQAVITLVLAFFQQFCGINAVIFYTGLIFTAAGYNNLQKSIASAVFAIVKALSAIVTAFLVDRLGRKVMLTMGSLGMAVSLSTLGVYFQLQITQSHHNVTWLPFTAIIVFAVSYGMGWGAIPGMIIAEIFPLPTRGLGNAFFVTTSSSLSFIITLIFLPLQDIMTTQGVFWLLASICVLAVLFIVLAIPETKGKALEHLHFIEHVQINSE